MTSLLLLSFATQLFRKEGITIPKLESSKYWDNTMVLLNGNSEFILATHSETNWKIDVWKTGGLLYFSPASTSPDMTQPADNINLITTRHMSTTVTRYNDVVYYAADMQTQSTVRDDKVQAIASHHNLFVINDIINDENDSLTSFDVSKQFCRMQIRSRNVVTYNGYEESSWHSAHEGTVDIYCFVRPSTCNYGNQYAAQFPEGIIINYEEMKIISLDKMECSHVTAQYNSGGNGTSQKPVYADQRTETDVHWHLYSSFDFMTDNRMTFDEFIAEPWILSLQPKMPVSTMNVVDQCGWAGNVRCKNNQISQDFLLDQFKHYHEAVIAIKPNSIGTRSSSSQAMKYCSNLTSDRTTKINNATELGYKCMRSPKNPQHKCQGSELGTSQLTSLRLTVSIPQPDRLYDTMIIDPLYRYSTHDNSLITQAMSSIGGQQEVISVPGGIEGIEKPVEGVGTDRTVMYQPTVTPIRREEEFEASV